MSSEQHARNPAPGRPAPAPCSDVDAAAPQAADCGSKPDAPADAAPEELSEREGLKLLLEQLRELREFVAYFAAAKTDSVKLAARNALGRIVLAALGFVAVAGLIIMASWFALSGVAQGAGAWFGDRAWIGVLLTGVLTLAGVGSGIFLAVSKRKHASRKRTVEKYETRHARQRARFGRDLQD